MNILICEDHKLIAMDLEDMLSAQGHTIEGTVGSACDCLERCAENPPDLVVTNLNLADGRTGLGLVDALAEQGIPAVIVSSDAESVPVSTPAKAVVKKPVHECELAIAVGRLELRRDPPRRPAGRCSARSSDGATFPVQSPEAACLTRAPKGRGA